MHETFHGQANLAVLRADGAAVAYAGNTENPVYTFRLGRIGIASTALYSIDRSLFRFAAPGATERRVVRPGGAVALDDARPPRRDRRCHASYGLARTHHRDGEGPMEPCPRAPATPAPGPRCAADAGADPDLGLLARPHLIDAVVNAAVQSRLKFDDLVEPGTEGRSLAFVAAASFFFAIAVQPTVGAISDYATTRWGRRKPFIVGGALFDALFLIGIASANSLAGDRRVRRPCSSLSTNIARGPFQGYVPDLVPDEQVGLASAMVGLMQVLGNVLGFGLAAVANSQGNVGLAILAIATIELVTMISVVVGVPNGPPAKPRNGRSWRLHRGGDLGNGHPPRAELRLAPRVPAASSSWAARASSTSSSLVPAGWPGAVARGDAGAFILMLASRASSA